MCVTICTVIGRPIITLISYPHTYDIFVRKFKYQYPVVLSAIRIGRLNQKYTTQNVNTDGIPFHNRKQGRCGPRHRFRPMRCKVAAVLPHLQDSRQHRLRHHWKTISTYNTKLRWLRTSLSLTSCTWVTNSNMNFRFPYLCYLGIIKNMRIPRYLSSIGGLPIAENWFDREMDGCYAFMVSAGTCFIELRKGTTTRAYYKPVSWTT